MNCEQVKEQLSAFLDNALAPEEQRAVALHLQTCADCRAILADYRYNDTLIAQIPRIQPDPSLQERLFSSPEYLELTGTFGSSTAGIGDGQTVPHQRIQRTPHPHLVALPGGRQSGHTEEDEQALPTHPRRRGQPNQPSGVQRVMYLLIAASLLLTIGVSALIGYNLWHKQTQITQDPTGLTPPAGLQQGPIPAGVRFVFQRDGALWSAPTDGGGAIVRITPPGVMVAANFAVRSPLPGRSAGNMIAYVDLQQGTLHTIRSDGQSDTTITQPLLKAGVSPTAVWDTETGHAVLNSLCWSKDGTMLAFVADPRGNSQPGLYLYTPGTGETHEVPLPTTGAVAHPIWSPDGIRIAFEFTRDGHTGILDYNTQNHGILTIVQSVATPSNPTDSVMDLDWSSSSDMPAITWSVGTTGRIHSIWSQRVGGGHEQPLLLSSGEYSEADYHPNANHGVGSWLLTQLHNNTQGDVLRVDLNSAIQQLTRGKQVSGVTWSPDGNRAIYFDHAADGVGALHMLNTLTAVDTLLAAQATNEPMPAWSPDGSRLAYSTGSHVLLVEADSNKASQPLKLSGPATMLSWSVSDPHQLVVGMGDGQQGIYLVDTAHDTALRLDKALLQGAILWTQIP